MNLNIKQKRILELLSINARFSNKDIAKAIKISEDTVKYQIDNLIDKQKLAKFNVQFYYPKLGYKNTHIWIKLKDRNIDFNIFNDIPEINSVNSNYGKFDLQVFCMHKTNKELQETIKLLYSKLEIIDLKHATVIDNYKRFTNVISPININTKIPSNKKNFVYELNEKQYAKSNHEKIYLDETDKLIIKELIENPRISFFDISKKTNLNRETIRLRVRKYIEKRFIINFGLFHDFPKYGLYTTYFLLKVNQLQEAKFISFLNTNKNILYSAKLDGDYDAIVYVTSTNPIELGKEYENILNFLGDSILSLDLLFWDKQYKYVQFPEKELIRK